MKCNMYYQWEMETIYGVILQQFEKDGTENTWKKLDCKKIVRVTFLPRIPLLPKHSIILDLKAGEYFVKRFGRGFIKARNKYQLTEYINCVETNAYRYWVFSNGNTLVTKKDFEVRV